MSTEKLTVLALCAHPDDTEIHCGGTLLLLAKQGWNVHVATLTSGDCGSAEECSNAIAIRRTAEADAAAKRLGGSYHCLGGLDLQVYDDNAMRSAAVAVLREVQPDCIITHYPVDYMPDHEAASAVTRMADFTAPMRNYTVGRAAFLEPTKGVVPLYYFGPMENMDYFGNVIKPQFYVDVSSVISTKAEALGCHVSQREWLRRQHGIDQYIDEMKSWDAEAGSKVGAQYAEVFIMHKGSAFPRTPIIENALAEYIRKER
jgi:LmbE family N-acetylglucosaminyl deacetylase